MTTRAFVRLKFGIPCLFLCVADETLKIYISVNTSFVNVGNLPPGWYMLRTKNNFEAYVWNILRACIGHSYTFIGRNDVDFPSTALQFTWTEQRGGPFRCSFSDLKTLGIFFGPETT